MQEERYERLGEKVTRDRMRREFNAKTYANQILEEGSNKLFKPKLKKLGELMSIGISPYSP